MKGPGVPLGPRSGGSPRRPEYASNGPTAMSHLGVPSVICSCLYKSSPPNARCILACILAASCCWAAHLPRGFVNYHILQSMHCGKSGVGLRRHGPSLRQSRVEPARVVSRCYRFTVSMHDSGRIAYPNTLAPVTGLKSLKCLVYRFETAA